VIKFLIGFFLGFFVSLYITQDFKNLILEYFNLLMYYIEN